MLVTARTISRQIRVSSVTISYILIQLNLECLLSPPTELRNLNRYSVDIVVASFMNIPETHAGF